MATQPLNSTHELTHHVSRPLPSVSENGGIVSSLPSSSPMDLLQLALQNNAAIDVIERIAALQEKAMLREAEIRFGDALARIQAEIKRVAPDLVNPQTSSRYSSYAAIDRVVRPIYTREGMSLSFSDGESDKPDHVRVICFARIGAHVHSIFKDMPTDGKGAKGGDVMTKTHATAAADSYAKRYLVKNLFNIAIGEDDNDGNYGGSVSVRGQYTPMHPDRVRKLCFEIANSATIEECRGRYLSAQSEAKKFHDRAALDAFVSAKDARKRELQ